MLEIEEFFYYKRKISYHFVEEDDKSNLTNGGDTENNDKGKY